jgi:hypothetical protein
MRLCGRSACFVILRKTVYTILGILKGNLGLKTWAVMRNLLVICVDHYFHFVQLPKLQFLWAMLHLTSLWTNSRDICILLECDWFMNVIQPSKVALYMGMLLWSDFLGPISWELWANFVTIDIVTIMTSGLIEKKLESCWSLMTLSLGVIEEVTKSLDVIV